MTTLLITDLAHSRELDAGAMRALRGGMGFASPNINVHVPINISQANHMAQNTNVLNHSIIGPGVLLPGLMVSPNQWSMNSLSLPSTLV